jgi:phage terminase small subunit
VADHPVSKKGLRDDAVKAATDTILNAKGLSARQRQFVAEYLVDRNGAQAAIRAGYSPNRAKQQANILLKTPVIKSAVAAALASQVKGAVSRADRILAELDAIAFSRIDRAMTWGGTRVTLIPSSHIDAPTLAAIAEVSETPGPHGTRLKVKLHPKLPALIKLGEREGLFERADDEGEALTPVAVQLNVADARKPEADDDESAENTDSNDKP